MSTINRVNADRALTWLADGWRIFKTKPLLLILSLVFYLAIILILAIIPLIGSLISALLSPALIAGFFVLAERVYRSEAAGYGTFLEPLRDGQARRPLLMLGALSLGFGILIAILLMAFVLGGANIFEAAGQANPAEALNMARGGGAALGILVLFLASIGFAMAMFYAPPLVYFQNIRPWAAIKLSLAGCLGNILPLLVFGLMGFILIFVAMIPFGLGLLVVSPMLIGASYASYLDIFEANTVADSGDDRPQPPRVTTVERP